MKFFTNVIVFKEYTVLVDNLNKKFKNITHTQINLTFYIFVYNRLVYLFYNTK